MNLYWIGNNNNYTDTTKWSLTSGGSPAGVAPTSSDNIFFDSHSPGNCVINTNSNCANYDATGFTYSIAFGSSLLTIYGTVINLGTGVTYTNTTGYFRINTPVLNQTTVITSSGLSSDVITVGIETIGTTGTYTIVNKLYVSNLILSNASLTINGDDIYVLGNLTSTISSQSITNNNNIVMGGTGTINNSIGTAGVNNLTIDTAGTITILTFAIVSRLNYVSGTVDGSNAYILTGKVSNGTTFNLSFPLQIKTLSQGWDLIINTNQLTVNNFSVALNLSITGTGSLRFVDSYTGTGTQTTHNISVPIIVQPTTTFVMNTYTIKIGNVDFSIIVSDPTLVSLNVSNYFSFYCTSGATMNIDFAGCSINGTFDQNPTGTFTGHYNLLSDIIINGNFYHEFSADYTGNKTICINGSYIGINSAVNITGSVTLNFKANNGVFIY